MEKRRRLYRSNDAVIAGVCAGIAEYFSVSPTFVRTVAVILLVVGAGSPILIYLVLALVLPRRPADYTAYVDVDPVKTSPKAAPTCPQPPDGTFSYEVPRPPCPGESGTNPGAGYSAAYCTTTDVPTNTPPQRKKGYLWIVCFGIILVLVGLGNIVGQFVPGIHWWSFWPLAIVFYGVIHACSKGDKCIWAPTRMFDGLVIATVGFVALACTMGNLVGEAVWDAELYLWPLFLAAAGVAVIGNGIHSNVVRCVASVLLCFVLCFGCYIAKAATPMAVLLYDQSGTPIALINDGGLG